MSPKLDDRNVQMSTLLFFALHSTWNDKTESIHEVGRDEL